MKHIIGLQETDKLKGNRTKQNTLQWRKSLFVRTLNRFKPLKVDTREMKRLKLIINLFTILADSWQKLEKDNNSEKHLSSQNFQGYVLKIMKTNSCLDADRSAWIYIIPPQYLMRWGYKNQNGTIKCKNEKEAKL